MPGIGIEIPYVTLTVKIILHYQGVFTTFNIKKPLYLIALAHPNASLDGVCGTIWAQRERSCKVQTSCRVLSVEGDAFDVVKFGEKLSVLILKTA